ncbi:serine/threonine/tyrosine-interacting-like protein 2 [Denticeps clupeoides]|nr:inactive dual specificity phosphatase 27 [Denticeps clupeoides]
MASPGDKADEVEQMALSEDQEGGVKSIQSHYLRCPSPSRFSTASDRFSTMTDRFSMISGFSNSESIFMEPIHLSSAVAAKKIINEELPQKEVRITPMPESMMETAEQLMVEDLYNRVKDMIDDRSPYNTPCVLDIQRALVQDRLEAPFNPVDEVWPNIFIGEKSVAVNKARLKRLGITHILNVAHGTGVYTSEAFYAGMSITYTGIELDDFPDADIAQHFRTAAEFLDEALLTHRGKALVTSMMGVSRSAILVAAYLMIFQNMTIMEALLAIRKKRAINPNEGFIKQLREFNENLQEERDDDDDTLSQCSVIDARARLDEEESMMGVKANSIMVEEEEDTASMMSSVASSAAAAALRAGVVRVPNGVNAREDPALPGKGDEEDEDDVDNMIREWQNRNEKYQNEDWWEAQLLSDGEDDGEPIPGKRLPPADDLESVTSEDVRAVKERVKRRPRCQASDSVSTVSRSSYSDLWKQRLREIEEQAAARYKTREQEEDEEDDGGATTGDEATTKNKRKKKIDEDLESIMSDSSSLYNFCKKNKDKLTPLERWKIKRIQFGWNKKEGETDNGGENGEQKERETPTPSLEDVSLTAYQSWKLKQQKKHGGEENKAELLEMARGEDSATARRRQRREELLEQSRRNLEESQSMCGWDSESSLGGGAIPLSAFCAGAFPAPGAAADDNASVLSGGSSVLSLARSARPPPAPPVPMAASRAPGGEPMVNLAGIQNWIANVVAETLMQKQGEAPSTAGSVLGFGAGSRLGSVRGADDDKASMLSGASYSSRLSRGRPESVLSAGGASSLSAISGFGSRRSKITTTSVPLYSLFQDQVNLRKLDSMDKEIKLEMKDKMAAYEKKKIVEDNKRSTLYKKKRNKAEDDEQDETDPETGAARSAVKSSGGRATGLPATRPKLSRDYGQSGRLNISGLGGDQSSSIDEWLRNVRPPTKKSEAYDEGEAEQQAPWPSYDAEPGPSEYDFSNRRASYMADEGEEDYCSASRFGSRYQADGEYADSSRDISPEPAYQPRMDSAFNGFSETNSYRRSYTAAGEDGYEECPTSRRFATQSPYSSSKTESRGQASREDDEDEVNSFLSQLRQRCQARAQRELEEEEDEVIAAWRKQEQTKSQRDS